MRATGLLVIEVINSNPNGDPDRESDPRQRPDGKGEISPVSFKRKVRDLIENQDGAVWQEVSAAMSLDRDRFAILDRGRDRIVIAKELKDNDAQFKNKYWDGRIFGNTLLEEGAADTIRTGVVQFGLGLSVARLTSAVIPIQTRPASRATRIAAWPPWAIGSFPMASTACPSSLTQAQRTSRVAQSKTSTCC